MNLQKIQELKMFISLHADDKNLASKLMSILEVEQALMIRKPLKPDATIDRVTPTNLDVALRCVGIEAPKDVLDKIIDVIEIIEVKGDKTNLMDMAKIEADHAHC